MTRPTAEHARAFATNVAKTSKCLEALVAALGEEQRALSQHEPYSLDAVLPRKQQVLAELEPLLKARNHLQQALGLAAGIPGGDALLAHLPEDSPPAKAWARLRDLATQVERLNNQNGHLVRQGQQTTQQALGILTGRKNEPGLYGRGGQGKGRLASLTFGKV